MAHSIMRVTILLLRQLEFWADDILSKSNSPNQPQHFSSSGFPFGWLLLSKWNEPGAKLLLSSYLPRPSLVLTKTEGYLLCSTVLIIGNLSCCRKKALSVKCFSVKWRKPFSIDHIHDLWYSSLVARNLVCLDIWDCKCFGVTCIADRSCSFE